MQRISVHSDRTHYEEHIAIPGMTKAPSLRQIKTAAAAILADVLFAMYTTHVLHLSVDQIMFVLFVLPIGIWASGYWMPDEMKLEEWLPVWSRHNFGTTHMTYGSRNRFEDAGLIKSPKSEASSAWKKFAKKQRGLELWNPAEGEEGAPASE